MTACKRFLPRGIQDRCDHYLKEKQYHFLFIFKNLVDIVFWFINLIANKNIMLVKQQAITARQKLFCFLMNWIQIKKSFSGQFIVIESYNWNSQAIDQTDINAFHKKSNYYYKSISITSLWTNLSHNRDLNVMWREIRIPVS